MDDVSAWRMLARTHFSSIVTWNKRNTIAEMQSYSFEMTFSLPSTLFLPSRVDGLAFIARPWHAGTSRVGSLVFHRQRWGDEYFVCHISAHRRKRKPKCNFDFFFLDRTLFEKKNQKTNTQVAQLQKKLEKYHANRMVSINACTVKGFSRTVRKLLSACCNHPRAREFEGSLPVSLFCLVCSHNFERPSASSYTVCDWRTKQSDTTQTVPLALVLIEAMGHKDH